MRYERFLLGLGLCFLTLPAWAGSIVAVISSDLGPYKEALKGLQETLGEVQVFNLQTDANPSIGNPKVIVALGGQAALKDYPASAALVYGMVPDNSIKPKHDGDMVRIDMMPRAASLVSKVKEINPGAGRLAVFQVSDHHAGYVKEVKAAAAEVGMKVVVETIEGLTDLPAKLRAIKGEVDAMWIAPDPILVNPQTFAVMREFGFFNKICLIVPVSALVEKGAVASVAASFKDMGKAAGRAAKALAAGETSAEVVYPDRTEVALNKVSASKSGLTLPAGLLKSADKVVTE
jgi:ABC-type uncharacterized transport system substrate-binding protein